MITIQQAIVTLIAAIISGILATIITIYVNKYNEGIRIKQMLIDDIFGFKYQLTSIVQNNKIDIYSQGFVRAMNRVTIVFCNDKNVLDALDKFYDTILIADPMEKKNKSDEALIVLIKEMCGSAHIKCDKWNDSRFKRTFNL